MRRFTNLDHLLRHIWSYANEGARMRDNAMSWPVFVTNGPGARTVALRTCDPEKRLFTFHTDRRSRKVRQLEENPRSLWLAFDRKINQQFQFFGATTIHTDDDFADSIWEREAPEELAFYFKKVLPAQKLEAPGTGMDFDNITEEEARQNFAALRTEIDEIIWQHLHPEGEYRARFVWNGKKFIGSWIVP